MYAPFPGPWLTLLGMINSIQENETISTFKVTQCPRPTDPKINRDHLLVMTFLLSHDVYMTVLIFKSNVEKIKNIYSMI